MTAKVQNDSLQQASGNILSIKYYMRRSPAKQLDKSQKHSKNKSLSPQVSSGSSSLYFCHYKNAMYMGGVKSFKKEGKGILLHDNGVSVLSTYYNDIMHGHNVFFAQHCLLSAEYNKNKIVSGVYRTDGFLLSAFYNLEGLLEGKCLLLNYINKSITYCTFRKGVMIDKTIETDFAVNNRAFDLNDVQFLIGKTHAKIIKYQVDKISNIQSQKFGNKLSIGFQKNGLMNGLGFTLIFQGSHGGYNPDTHRNEDPFELKISERGYFMNSQLNGFGEKWFKNGNFYIGEFRNGIIEGNGVLKNPNKKNWVSGFFEKGNLIDMLEYNNEGQDKKYDAIIEALHERKTNWINHNVNLPDLKAFDLQIQKFLSISPNNQTKTLEQRKQEVLKKIQENFVCDSNSAPAHFPHQETEPNAQSYQAARKDSMKKFVRNFIPEDNTATTRKYELNIDPPPNEARRSSGAIVSSRKNSIRRSSIFQKNNSSQSMDSLIRIDRGSSPRKRIQKTSDRQRPRFFNDSSFKQNPKASEAQQNSPSRDILASQRSREAADSKASNSGMLDSKRMVGKSKIFKYLQTQKDQVTPKFSYTQVEPAKDAQRRKTFMVEEPFSS